PFPTMATILNRRNFLGTGAAGLIGSAAFAPARSRALAAAPVVNDGSAPLKIEAVELIELHGSYTDEGGVNGQAQVNPEDIYDSLRHPPYADHPSCMRQFRSTAIYVRIRTA